MNGIEWRERELTLSLISRLAGQLPERTLLCSCGKPKGTVHEVGCYGDQREIRLSLTEAERDHLLRVLRRFLFGEETLVPQSPQKPRR